MHFDYQLFFSALGLAFIIEGLPYFLMPDKMRDAMRMLSERDPRYVRLMGVGGIICGLCVLLIVLG